MYATVPLVVHAGLHTDGPGIHLVPFSPSSSPPIKTKRTFFRSLYALVYIFHHLCNIFSNRLMIRLPFVIDDLYHCYLPKSFLDNLYKSVGANHAAIVSNVNLGR